MKSKVNDSDWFVQGWNVFKDSLRVLRAYPVMMLPLFGSWVVLAAVTLLGRYYEFSALEALGGLFLVTYSISLSCLMLLEFMEQVERGEPTSYKKALHHLISRDALKAIPLALVWAILWAVLLVIRALTKKDTNEDTPEASLEDAGRTLSGLNNNPFSWVGLGLSLLGKLLRMIVFACLPAIAWENKGSFGAFKKGVSLVRTHPKQFLASFGLTESAGLLMVLPLVPLAVLLKAEVDLPSIVWIGVIIYSGIIWTVEVYLEQMSIALLYLWHIKAERMGISDLSQVPRPQLLDGVPEFDNRSDGQVL